jgi:hypothetical protein
MKCRPAGDIGQPQEGYGEHKDHVCCDAGHQGPFQLSSWDSSSAGISSSGITGSILTMFSASANQNP